MQKPIESLLVLPHLDVLKLHLLDLCLPLLRPQNTNDNNQKRCSCSDHGATMEVQHHCHKQVDPLLMPFMGNILRPKNKIFVHVFIMYVWYEIMESHEFSPGSAKYFFF